MLMNIVNKKRKNGEPAQPASSAKRNCTSQLDKAEPRSQAIERIRSWAIRMRQGCSQRRASSTAAKMSQSERTASRRASRAAVTPCLFNAGIINGTRVALEARDEQRRPSAGSKNANAHYLGM
jgi:hypothetical protein